MYDGDIKIAGYDGLDIQGERVFVRKGVEGRKEVLWGTAISVAVNFNGNGGEDYVQVLAAGIDFYV